MHWPRIAIAVAASALVLTTRLPASPAWTAAAVLGTGFFIAGAVWSARRPKARVARALVIVGALATLALPEPWAPTLDVAPWASALAGLAALHANLPSADVRPSRQGSTWVRQAVVRGAPIAALLALVVSLPWFARLALPPRLAMVQEWDAPIGPLVVGLAVGLVLVAAANLHALASRRTVEPEDELPAGGDA